MTFQLLRLEAINLSYVIDDTEDLSTRRSGGYMLLQAVRDVEEKFKESIKPISTGASVGLFEILTTPPDNDLINRIKQFLSCEDKPYRHATFAITVVQGGNFRALVEQSISNIRWQQMQSLNFTTCWKDTPNVCKTDEVRPGSEKYNTESASLSVYERGGAGKKLRQEFYEKEFEKHNDLIQRYQLSDLIFSAGKPFTNNTEALSKFEIKANEYKSIPLNLNGKMAVFYADGNSFGKIQQDCTNSEELSDWDNEIKNKRRILLAELLKFMQSTALSKTKDNELRFETLLWGGDEMLFLIPAWLGLEFAQKFFESTRCWRQKEKPLTHAAGLVFASHAAPISQLQKLAKKLADHGKAYSKKQNTVSWIVLESFDHAGDDMHDYWQRSAISKNGWQKLLLTQYTIEDLRKIVQPIKNELPRSAIVRVLRSLAAGKAGEKDEITLLQRSYESVDEVLINTGKQEDFIILWKTLTGETWRKTPAHIPPDDAVGWTILMELWDYLLPDAQTITSGATR